MWLFVVGRDWYSREKKIIDCYVEYLKEHTGIIYFKLQKITSLDPHYYDKMYFTLLLNMNIYCRHYALLANFLKSCKMLSLNVFEDTITYSRITCPFNYYFTTVHNANTQDNQ